METKIKYKKVCTNAINKMLKEKLGRYAIDIQPRVFSTLAANCEDYNGGCWDFYATDNGAFFMMPTCADTFKLCGPNNFFEGELSAQATGLFATTMAINHLLWDVYGTDPDGGMLLNELFYKLQDVIVEHKEVCKIMGALN